MNAAKPMNGKKRIDTPDENPLFFKAWMTVIFQMYWRYFIDQINDDRLK